MIEKGIIKIKKKTFLYLFIEFKINNIKINK